MDVSKKKLIKINGLRQFMQPSQPRLRLISSRRKKKN